METEEYNESRRREKSTEKLHEIQQQNFLAKIFLGFFLLLLSISFVAFLAGDTGLASGLLFIFVLKFPIIGGFCIYKIIKNKIKKRKLELHMSDDSLTAMYDWDYAKCRQCGGSDFAEIKSDDPYSLFELEEQIRKGEVVLRCAHHGNAALQCNGCGKWGYKKSDSTEPEFEESGYNLNSCEGMGRFDDHHY